MQVISQVGDSVALVRSSEEDVYYRDDSMTVVRVVVSICIRNVGVGVVIQYCREEKRKKKREEEWEEFVRIYTVLALEPLARKRIP